MQAIFFVRFEVYHIEKQESVYLADFFSLNIFYVHVRIRIVDRKDEKLNEIF